MPEARRELTSVADTTGRQPLGRIEQHAIQHSEQWTFDIDALPQPVQELAQNIGQVLHPEQGWKPIACHRLLSSVKEPSLLISFFLQNQNPQQIPVFLEQFQPEVSEILIDGDRFSIVRFRETSQILPLVLTPRFRIDEITGYTNLTRVPGLTSARANRLIIAVKLSDDVNSFADWLIKTHQDLTSHTANASNDQRQRTMLKFDKLGEIRQSFEQVQQESIGRPTVKELLF